MKIAIVSRAFNEETLITHHVMSLFEQAAMMPGVDFEIHIVANGCEDDTAYVARRAIVGLQTVPRVTCFVHELPEPGSTAALNYGIAHSSGGTIVVTDADTTMGANCLPNVVSCLDRPGIRLAGATHDTYVPGHMRSTGIGYVCRTQSIIADIAGWYPLPVAGMTAFRRTLLEGTGMYDEVMVSCDDTRMALWVVRLFGPKSVMVHPDAFVFSTPPPDIPAFLRMKARHRVGHQRMLDTEPSLIPVSEWRQNVLAKIVRRAQERRPEILDRMAAEGIPLETLDLLEAPMPAVFGFMAAYEPPQRDEAGHWRPEVRVAPIPA